MSPQAADPPPPHLQIFSRSQMPWTLALGEPAITTVAVLVKAVLDVELRLVAALKAGWAMLVVLAPRDLRRT